MKLPLFEDRDTKTPSVSLTILVVTFLVAILKILLANVSIKGYTIPNFTASDFGVLLAAPSALYYGRKGSKGQNETKKEVSE